MHHPPEFAATEAGALALRATRGRLQANVVSCMQRSAYLQVGPALVCVGAPSIGRGPLNIRLAGGIFEAEFRARLKRGTLIALRRGLPGAVLVLDLSATATWGPESVLAPLAGPASIPVDLEAHERVDTTTLGLAQRALLACSPGGCEGQPVDTVSRSWRAQFECGIQALMRWCTSDRRAGVRNIPPAAWDLLVGHGPGLTPAGDDALVGALIAMTRLGLFEHRRLLIGALDSCLEQRTSMISAAHLRAAFEGLAAEVVHNAMESLLRSPRSFESSPGGDFAALLSYGASSGPACCAGMLAVTAGYIDRGP